MVVVDNSTFISYGIGIYTTWANVELSGNVVLTTDQVNAATNLYKGFDATFDFCGNRITINQTTGSGQDLTKSLFMDLSGGKLKNLNLTINDVKFGSTFKGGVLVGGDSTNTISYGDISNVNVEANNVIIIPSGAAQLYHNRSLILSPSFASTHTENINITGIDISGTNVGNDPSITINDTYSYGLLFNYAFHSYGGSATINNVTNKLIIKSPYGSVFGKTFGTLFSGPITVSDCINYGDISGNNSAGLFGDSAGESSTGHITITNCKNYGAIRSNESNGIVGEYAHRYGSGTFDIFNSNNYGNIYGDYSNGILGNSAGSNRTTSSSAIIEIQNCDNSGIIFGQNCGGIIGGGANTSSIGKIKVLTCNNYGDISNNFSSGIVSSLCGHIQGPSGEINVRDCDNRGNIYGNNCSGIVGYQANLDASGTIDISNCNNYGNINGTYSAGIVGYQAGYKQKSIGKVTIRSCDNSGIIIGESSAGIVGYFANNQADASGKLNVFDCNNYRDISGSSSAGIVGYSLNQDSSGVVDISNCNNYGNINNLNSAGIVGYEAGYRQKSTGIITIRSCDNSGIIFGENSAGIVGSQANREALVSGTLNVFDCNNYRDISGSSSAGIVGYSLNQDSSGVVDISNCNNYGNINSFDSAGIVGNDAGYGQKSVGIITIRSCDNSGIIFGENSAGIVGNQANRGAAVSGTLNVFDCNNYRDISGLSSSGIVGIQLNYGSSGVVDISNCKNYCNINNINSAGIVGNSAGFGQNSAGIITIRGCDNSGNMLMNYSSGIVAIQANTDSNGKIIIQNCDNRGNIYGNNCSGIIGTGVNSGSSILCKTTILECDNYANIYGPSSTGILGDSANAGSNGELFVSHCVNYGGLFGKDSNFNNFNKGEYPYFNDTSYYAASSGIVGPSCGKGMAPGGNILIENCDNSGSFNAPYTSGITSFGLGIDSSGTIDISGCTNYTKLKYTGCAGISAGLIGINNRGTITFNNCANYGDISGVDLNKIETGCLIHSIGYTYSATKQTSGEINIINCINDNSCYNEEEVNVGGIIGIIYLSATKQINIDISNCENTINNVIVPSNCYICGICFTIADGYVGSTANNTISIHNCVANPLTSAVGGNVIDCKILFTLDSESFGKTPYTLNIYDNTINCGYIITSTFYISILRFIDNAVQRVLLNKNINIYKNNITVDDISSALIASMILSVKGLENCAIDICNNNVVINSMTGSSLSVCGILSESVEYLKNVDMLIRNNTIEINNISSTTATNVAGLIRVTTTTTSVFEFPGTFSNCDNFNLTITGNNIISNTLDALIDSGKGNAGLIGTNTDVDPSGSTYRGPIGTLILGNNAINNIVYDDDDTNNYFQPDFRPYIYVLDEYPGSNYWFNDGIVNVPLQIEIETDDAALRQIFKRAIKAINEQTQFEIYPFYQIKVKAKRIVSNVSNSV